MIGCLMLSMIPEFHAPKSKIASEVMDALVIAELGSPGVHRLSLEDVDS
jgi:hypothetical protein